jgi:cytochrome c oxidase subunit 3
MTPPRPHPTIDLSTLPDHAFGSRSIMWWSTCCIIAIEGTVFVMAIASYFYLQGNEIQWPPANTVPPGYGWATLNVLIILLSLVPNAFVKKAAEEENQRKVQVWMVVADTFALAFCVVRVFEYTQLNVSWDSNAYGSVTWTLLSLHSVHLLTDLIDSVVLTALMFTRHGNDGRRFVDVSENCFYWYFVVLSWLPIYAVIYWAPRLL